MVLFQRRREDDEPEQAMRLGRQDFLNKDRTETFAENGQLALHRNHRRTLTKRLPSATRHKHTIPWACNSRSLL